MIGWMKKRWLRAKALSILQTFYKLPLKEPLEGLDNLMLQQGVDVALDTGGNEWDAAAAYVYTVAVGILGSQTEIRGDNREAVTRLAHLTNTYHWMMKADSIRPLVRAAIQHWNAHPDHPSNRIRVPI